MPGIVRFAIELAKRICLNALKGNVSTVFIMDDAYIIYVHFSNTMDENSPAEFFLIAALTGSKQKFWKLPVRELAAFAAA